MHALSKYIIQGLWPGQAVVPGSGVTQCFMKFGAYVNALFLIRKLLRDLKPNTGCWLRIETLGVCRAMCILRCYGSRWWKPE